jgi:hypothetical protein
MVEVISDEIVCPSEFAVGGIQESVTELVLPRYRSVASSFNTVEIRPSRTAIARSQ